MRTGYVLCSRLPRGQASTLHTLALCALLLANPAFAQDPAAGQATAMQSLNTGAENAGATDLSAHENQAQSSSMPNAPSASRLASAQPGSLTFGDRFRIYRHSIFRPYTLIGPALGAGIGQWEDVPPQWGPGAEGYARRVASGVGRHVIAETIRFAVAAADGEDPRYHRSGETGFWHRAQHAIVETFTSETSNGARIPAFSRFAGTYGAAFVSNVWYPAPYATTGWALRRGSTALGSSVGFHLFEEFVSRRYFMAVYRQD